jgi:hypothetical protein
VSRAGVVDLRDLHVRYFDEPLHIQRFLAATQLSTSGKAKARFAPPSVVLAIAPLDKPELCERSRAWLQDAQHVILLREDDGKADTEMRALAESVWRDVLNGWPIPVEVFDWRRADDALVAVDRAIELAGGRDDEAPPAPLVEHDVGPRFELLRHRDYIDFVQILASRLTGTRLHLQEDRAAVSLLDPPRTVELDDHPRWAVLPDGRLIAAEGRQRFRIGATSFFAPGVWAVGFDGTHPVGWTGHRMALFWLYRARRGDVGFLSTNDHHWPCGPAKKLWGYKENSPCRVELAPDLSCVAHHFEHDVLLTSAVPVSFRSAGAVDVADFPKDSGRALFFVNEGDMPFADFLDEDARTRAPGLVLGRSTAVRYAVELGNTHRITQPNEPVVTALRGRGFAVFDAQHREVRRANGHLLAGAFGQATLVEDRSYFREDLDTGSRRRLAPVTGSVVCAATLPGSVNIVAVTADEGRYYAQLV